MGKKSVVREDVARIVFETQGIEDVQRMERSMDDLDRVLAGVSPATDRMGTALRGVGDDAGLARQDLGSLGNAANDLGDALRDTVPSTEGLPEALDKADDSADGLVQTADILKSALSSAAAAFSIGKLVENVSEAQSALNKLQAQAGLTQQEMTAFGDDVMALYNDGMGESLSDVADTAALVKQQFREMDASGIQQITQAAMAMSDTFGMDVNETLRGVNALMTNMGMTAQEAFDYIAAGAQNGLDKSGELEDNLAEYSQIWAQAGFSAQEMFTILQNGLDSGAYNLDKVNDFVKEFSISLSDGRIEENLDSFSGRTQNLFAAWQEGTASQKDVFQSVITDLSTMTSEQEALTLASNTWSALGEDNAMQVITSLNQVSSTYEDVEGTMDAINDIRYDDIGSSLEKLKRSASSLLTETLSPGLSSVSQWLSTGLEQLTAYAQEHQALASGMGMATTASALLTTGLVAVSGGILTVKKALDALNMSAGGALKIAGLVVGVGSALAGVLAGLHFAKKAKEVEDYNGTLEECRYEMTLTAGALEKAKERYGEDSDAVKQLESSLKTLHAQYEKGGGYLAELRQRVDAASEAYQALSQTQQENLDALDRTESSGLQAVSMLETLSQKATVTSADLDAMGKYAAYLNDTFHCNIEVDYSTGELTGFDPAAISKQIQQTMNANRSSEAMDYITGTDFTDQYLEHAKNYYEARQELQSLQTEFDHMSETVYYDFNADLHSADNDRYYELIEQRKEALDTVAEAEQELAAANADLSQQGKIAGLDADTIEDLRQSLMDTARSGGEFIAAAEETTEVLSAQEEGTARAQDTISSYKDQLYDLCQAYDEARDSAYESIQSQYQLWDSVGEIEATSASQIVSNLESQNAYWTQYNDNLELLQERAAGIEGLSDMLATMADGSEENSAALQALAGASDAELNTVAQNWMALKDKQQETADNMGDVATQFSAKCSEMQGDMQNMVGDMHLETEAASAASSTINAFFSTMLSGIAARRGEVESALSSLMSSASNVNVAITEPVEKNAAGTTNAADVFIAGEQGAELVLGMGGSTVFPAGETEKIIRAVQDYGGTPESTSQRSSVSTVMTFAPQFYLTQYGGGTDVVNQRQVKRWMQEALEDAFSGVLRTNPPVYTI